MMAYVLILVMANSSDYRSGVGGLTAEFNTLDACRAAADVIARQAKANTSSILAAVCAAKGKP